MAKSKIEWTDYTWNPLSGCQKVSPGCKNCYAERIYKWLNHGQPFDKLIYHYDRFDYPFPEQPPRKVFVGSMSDIMMAEPEFIAKIFEFICQDKYKQHTFQLLTKRPNKMVLFDYCLADRYEYDRFLNIWFGVSAENQEWADKRIPDLLLTPLNIKWVSLEPLIDYIDLVEYISSLSWVVVGGETGQHARPMHPDWVRKVQEVCKAWSVPFFFKSWGEWIPIDQVVINDTNCMTRLDDDGKTRYIRLNLPALHPVLFHLAKKA